MRTGDRDGTERPTTGSPAGGWRQRTRELCDMRADFVRRTGRVAP